MASYFDLARELHQQHPTWSALQVGHEVLKQLPTTSRAEMMTALSAQGFPYTDVNTALDTLYGVAREFGVIASQHWQNTTVHVDATQPTTITYVNGQWTANPATGMVNADGNPAHVAKPGYTMPGQYEGAMIGWIGGEGTQGQVVSTYPKFLVGSKATVPMGQTGTLFLSINDDEYHQYGAGFADNQGVILVQISQPPIQSGSAS